MRTSARGTNYTPPGPKEDSGGQEGSTSNHRIGGMCEFQLFHGEPTGIIDALRTFGADDPDKVNSSVTSSTTERRRPTPHDPVTVEDVIVEDAMPQ